MLLLHNLEYDSWQTIYFQRLSVIATELLLVYALHLYVSSSPKSTKYASHVAALSVLLSPGLLIIDHIHFQYNGFMYGLLLCSLVLARHESTILLSGALFAALLCFKHIYLYLAPAYFVYLLRTYCLGWQSIFHLRLSNSIKLGSSIIAVFVAAFGPFLYHGQTDQLLKRLFPFSRGLCHAYWAPNVWAMYSFVDRVLILGKLFVQMMDSFKLIHYSRTIAGTTSQPVRSQQRHTWPGRRYLFRSTSRYQSENNLPLHPLLSARE